MYWVRVKPGGIKVKLSGNGSGVAVYDNLDEKRSRYGAARILIRAVVRLREQRLQPFSAAQFLFLIVADLR